MSAINDLKHAVDFHTFVYTIGGSVDVDAKAVDLDAANRGLGRVNDAIARALRGAPRGLVASQKESQWSE